jgi:hypothetical protein
MLFVLNASIYQAYITVYLQKCNCYFPTVQAANVESILLFLIINLKRKKFRMILTHVSQYHT